MLKEWAKQYPKTIHIETLLTSNQFLQKYLKLVINDFYGYAPQIFTTIFIQTENLR